MKIPLFFFSLLFFLSLKAQNIKKLDEDYGFKGFVFETGVEKYNNMKLIDNDGNYTYYKYELDTLKINDCKLKEISYGFYKNKLYWISIKTGDYRDSKAILKILETMYGKGRKFNEYSETYGWEGEKVKMAYNQNTFNKNAIINIWSQLMADIIDKEKK